MSVEGEAEAEGEGGEKRKMKVRDIMSTPIITEEGDTGVIKIAKDMANLEVGSVVITSEGEPAGIITERDIALKVLLKYRGRRGSEVKAKEIMSSPLVTIKPEATVEEACELASAKNIKRLPVVESGVLIGIISVRNILTRKPEYVKRFYPEVRVLASGWTFDRLERSLSDGEVLFAEKKMERYRERLKEVYEELSKLVSYYVDDKELKDIFNGMTQLYHDVKGEGEEKNSIVEQRKRLETILRKIRHVTYGRKRQSVTSFTSGAFTFHDYRHGMGKRLRLPFKRTRP
ncbi:Inosine-5'-monophosphate dehydrogenase [ANME-1 cluster archaeon GoMg1]|nr:Inosine-5'-monophosphate dehydrogenase [ANME-1 cluster archaeon GoMg1]